MGNIFHVQKTRLATLVVVMVISSASLLNGCSRLAEPRLEHISPSAVERVVFVPNKVVEPRLVAKIIKIYNETPKKEVTGDLPTPNAQLEIYVRPKTLIIVNHAYESRFETHVVEKGSRMSAEFNSKELQRIFEDLINITRGSND